jgi:hypothetical protein
LRQPGGRRECRREHGTGNKAAIGMRRAWFSPPDLLTACFQPCGRSRQGWKQAANQRLTAGDLKSKFLL